MMTHSYLTKPVSCSLAPCGFYFIMRDYKIYFLVIDDISKAVPGLKLKRSYGKCFNIGSVSVRTEK